MATERGGFIWYELMTPDPEGAKAFWEPVAHRAIEAQINGPAEVPGGDWIVQGVDPQGAMFSLVGGK